MDSHQSHKDINHDNNSISDDQQYRNAFLQQAAQQQRSLLENRVALPTPSNQGVDANTSEAIENSPSKVALSVTLNPNRIMLAKIMARQQKKQQQQQQQVEKTRNTSDAAQSMEVTLNPISTYDPLNGMDVNIPNNSSSVSPIQGYAGKLDSSSNNVNRSSTSPGVDPMDAVEMRRMRIHMAGFQNDPSHSEVKSNGSSLDSSGLFVNGGGFSRSYLSSYAKLKQEQQQTNQKERYGQYKGANVGHNASQMLKHHTNSNHLVSMSTANRTDFMSQNDAAFSSHSADSLRGLATLEMRSRGIPLADDEMTFSSLQSAGSSVRTNFRLGNLLQGLPQSQSESKIMMEKQNCRSILQQTKMYDDSLADPNVNRFSFPMKLHDMLARSEYSDILTWLPSGTAWIVINSKRLEQEVLRKYFRHGKFSSFSRQVNGWGFVRVSSGKEKNAYYHELFLRDNPRQCRLMRRNYSSNSDLGNRQKIDSVSVTDRQKNSLTPKSLKSASTGNESRTSEKWQLHPDLSSKTSAMVSSISSSDREHNPDLSSFLNSNSLYRNQDNQIDPSQLSDPSGTFHENSKDNFAGFPHQKQELRQRFVGVRNDMNSIHDNQFMSFQESNLTHSNNMNPSSNIMRSLDQFQNLNQQEGILSRTNLNHSVSNDVLLDSLRRLQNQSQIRSLDQNNFSLPGNIMNSNLTANPCNPTMKNNGNNMFFLDARNAGVGLDRSLALHNIADSATTSMNYMNNLSVYEQLRKNFTGALDQSNSTTLNEFQPSFGNSMEHHDYLSAGQNSYGQSEAMGGSTNQMVLNNSSQSNVNMNRVAAENQSTLETSGMGCTESSSNNYRFI